MTFIILKLLIAFALIGVAMGLVERLRPANPDQKFMRRGFATDVVYWFLLPIISLPCTPIALAAAIHATAATCGFESGDVSPIVGFGPVAQQPFWLQTIEIILLMDFLDYWSHRLLHSARFWPIHAIHHSNFDLDWLAAVRNHPFNDLLQRIVAVAPLILVGFDPSLSAATGIVFAFYGFFVHANVDLDLGPLRRVLVSPRMHRWHHTSPDEGGERNYAGIFAIWDVLFGTYYNPAGAPRDFGTVEPLPWGVMGQLAWPFRANDETADRAKVG
jgi:sterol desaturase/sphingolipid hydroxylase (fatty acid hydroxylase superfamily)